MTPKACSPYPEPSLIGEFRDEYGLLADLFGDVRVPGPGKWLEASEGVDLKYAKMMNERLQAMWALPLDKVFEHLNGKVWNIVDKDGVQIPTRINLTPQQQGAWAGVFADYLYGKAAGIRQMAENFIAAASTPEGGMTQGLQLARQLQYMGQLGEITMGLQQATGLGVRVQGLRSRGLEPNVFDKMDLREAAKEAAGAKEFNDRLKMIADLLKDPRKSSEGMRLLMGEAERIKFMNDPISIVKGATGYKLANQAWNEWTINSMLSNPATWLVNAAGVAWAPLRAASQLLGAGMYNVAAAAGIADPAVARQVWAMSTGQLMGQASAFSDALVISWEALKSGRSLYDNWALDGSPDLRAITGENAQQALQKFGIDEITAGQKSFFDTLGTVIRTPSRMLLAADEFAKILAQRGEVAQRGIKRAIDAGVDPSDAAEIRRYLDAETAAAFEMRPDGKFGRLTEAYDGASALQEGFGGRTVKRVGDEATFQEPNRIATQVNNLTRGKGAVLKPFLPFVKTPTNILKQGLTENTLIGPILKIPGIVQAGGLSPTGIILEIQKQALKNPTETARITGQITFMTGVMAVMYNKAMEGTITGGGPARWGQGTAQEQQKAQRAWERANVPYSFKMGDTYVPFDKWPEPFATFMRMFADFGAASAYMSEEEKDGAFGTMVGIGAASLYQSSMLRGIDQLVSMIKNPGEFNQRAGANVQYWFATQTPLGGLMSYVDQIEDPYRSAYQESGLQYILNFEEIFGRGVLGKVAERFPGGSSVRPVQIDQLYGKPVPVSPGFGPNGMNPLLKAIPFLPRTLEEGGDEAYEAVLEMAGGWREYSPSAVDLTVGQQQKLNEDMGTMRLGGKTLSQALLELRRRPDVQRYVESNGSAPPETGTGIAKEVSALRTRYGNAAFARLFAGSVNLQQQLALKEQLRSQKRGNDVAGAQTTSRQIKQLLELASKEE